MAMKKYASLIPQSQQIYQQQIQQLYQQLYQQQSQQLYQQQFQQLYQQNQPRKIQNLFLLLLGPILIIIMKI